MRGASCTMNSVGRLAQRLERSVYTRKVVRSNRTVPTIPAFRRIPWLSSSLLNVGILPRLEHTWKRETRNSNHDRDARGLMPESLPNLIPSTAQRDPCVDATAKLSVGLVSLPQNVQAELTRGTSAWGMA